MLPPFFYRTPFFRLLLPFVAGIILGFYIVIGVEYCLLACFFSMIGTVFLLWKWKRQFGWLHGLFLNVFFFSVGICAVSLRAFESADISESGDWLVVVDEPPTERTNSMKTNLRVKAKITDEEETAYNELVVAYFRKDSLSQLLRQGDLLLIKGVLTPITNGGNPYEFDYKGFLARRQIGRSVFVGRWQKVGSYAQTPLFNFSNRIRNNLLDVLNRCGLSGNELAVVSALTLGYKADIDDELRQAYSASGGMHVLAVSGLHVGVVFLVLNTILMLFPFLNRVKWLRALIQLTALWLFALITGLSPSVMRAATMFSFVAIGKASTRRAYIYNSIAASAFILLLINPNILFEVSFQFSYSAVIAIVFLHSTLYQLLSFKNILLDKIWSLTCVSIAAQTGVAPLAMYYFHQFPSYFIMTNYIVIPAASIIIYGAVLLFIFAPVPFLLETLGWLLDKFVYGVNSLIFFIEKMPGSVIMEIRFAGWEIFLAYVLIGGMGAWMLTKHKTAIFAMLAAIALWTTGAAIRTNHDLQRRQLIVYNTQGNSLLQFIEGRNNTVWYAARNATFNASNFLNAQRTAMQLAYANYHILDSTLNAEKMPKTLFADDNFVQFADKRIVIFTRQTPPQNAGSHAIRTDVAILTQNINARITQIIETYNPEIIVIDASSTRARIARWEQECVEAGVKYHRVDRDGAFVLLSIR